MWTVGETVHNVLRSTGSSAGLSHGARPTLAISTHSPPTWTRTISAVKSLFVPSSVELLNRYEPTP